MPLAESEALGAARALRELIESEADAIEAAATLTGPVVDALAESGLFKLTTPAELGGSEAHTDTLLEVCEELSFADGSVGWAYAQNVTVGAYSAYVAPKIGRELARARTAAGMFAPMGVAVPEPGGYRVQGRYKFASGSAHAEWIGGGATALKDGQPVPMPGGGPPILAFVIPIEKAKLASDWDVMGLRGTGSYDFDVPEQFIEEGACFELFAGEPRTGGPLYRMGALNFGVAGSCAWAIGVASRALHEIAAVAMAGRTRMGSQPLLEQAGFQRDFGFHHAGLRSARGLARQSFRELIEACQPGQAPELRFERMRTAMAESSYAVRTAKAATVWAFETSGSAGIRNPSVLQRCFRDICVGAGHQVFDDRTFVQSAQQILGLPVA